MPSGNQTPRIQGRPQRRLQAPYHLAEAISSALPLLQPSRYSVSQSRHAFQLPPSRGFLPTLHVRPEISASGPIDYEALTLLDDSLYVAAEAEVYDVKAVVTQAHDEFNVKRNETKDRKEGTPASVFEWYGIIFDLETDTLSLPEAKRLKYLLFVLNAPDSEALDRRTIEKLIGLRVRDLAVLLREDGK